LIPCHSVSYPILRNNTSRQCIQMHFDTKTACTNYKLHIKRISSRFHILHEPSKSRIMRTAIATIFILADCANLSTAQNLHVAGTPPPLPVPSSSTDPYESLKKKCLKNAGTFVGLLRPVDACKPLRTCKKVCRQEKRGDMRGCRKVKRSCKDVTITRTHAAREGGPDMGPGHE